jgi:hypothetical protein
MRNTLALLGAIAAVFTFVTISANAMPAASLKTVTSSDQTITHVRGGCGRGWHRWHGRCVRGW